MADKCQYFSRLWLLTYLLLTLPLRKSDSVQSSNLNLLKNLQHAVLYARFDEVGRCTGWSTATWMEAAGSTPYLIGHRFRRPTLSIKAAEFMQIVGCYMCICSRMTCMLIYVACMHWSTPRWCMHSTRSCIHERVCCTESMYAPRCMYTIMWPIFGVLWHTNHCEVLSGVLTWVTCVDFPDQCHSNGRCSQLLDMRHCCCSGIRVVRVKDAVFVC